MDIRGCNGKVDRLPQQSKLPKAVSFPEGVHQVEIITLGNSRLITPVGRRWELLYLVEKSMRRNQNLQAVEHFAARLEVMPFSAKAAAHFGQVRAELAALGTFCGAYDMLIGAHARSEGLTLVTNNVREFQRIPGLRVDNWVPA